MRLERDGAVAVMVLEAGKANAINTAFLDALEKLLDELEASDARGLLFTGYQHYFCAGLDLAELLGYDRDGMEAFIRRFGALGLRMFGLDMPVVAAINGHAVAGGCVLAQQADFRVMAEGKGRIGLREVALGIGLPAAVIETLRALVPTASLRPIALEGKLFSAEEARALGLIEEVAPFDELQARARARLDELMALPTKAFAHIKRGLRRPYVEAVEAQAVMDAAEWVDTWFSEDGQRLVRATVASFQKKK